MESPFINVQMGTREITAIRMKYVGESKVLKNKLPAPNPFRENFSVVFDKFMPTKQVSSFEEAEDYILSELPNAREIDIKNLHPESNMNFFYSVSRAGNLIAVNTRNKTGNILLLSPYDYQILESLTTKLNSVLNLTSDPTNIGRWTFVGTMSSINIYLGPIPAGTCYALYKGEGNLDGPFFYSEDESSKWVSTLPNTPNCVCDYTGYVIKFKIEL